MTLEADDTLQIRSNAHRKGHLLPLLLNPSLQRSCRHQGLVGCVVLVLRGPGWRARPPPPYAHMDLTCLPVRDTGQRPRTPSLEDGCGPRRECVGSPAPAWGGQAGQQAVPPGTPLVLPNLPCPVWWPSDSEASKAARRLFGPGSRGWEEWEVGR